MLFYSYLSCGKIAEVRQQRQYFIYKSKFVQLWKMLLAHPLETPGKVKPKMPEFFVYTDSAFSVTQLTDCHYPTALFYQAPSEILIGGKPVKPYRVLPYDEYEIKRYHYQQAQLVAHSVYEVQKLLTFERAKYAKTPYIVQSFAPQPPKAVFDYSTSSKHIFEELGRDLIYPRLAVNTDGVDIATITGNDRIAVGGICPQPESEFDTIQGELFDAFYHIFYEGKRKEEEEARKQQVNMALQQFSNFQPQAINPGVPQQFYPAYCPYQTIEASNMLIYQAQYVIGARQQYYYAAPAFNVAIQQPYNYQLLTGNQRQQAEQAVPNMVSSNTAQSPPIPAYQLNQSLYIECDMDDEVDRIITKNYAVCQNAAQMIANTKYKYSDDIELEVGSNDLGISSTSYSNPVPVTTIPAALSEESGEQKPYQQKKLVRKQPQQAKQEEAQQKPSSVKRQPTTRPESVLHQINESKSAEDLNESAYIKGILAGNDSTTLDLNESIHTKSKSKYKLPAEKAKSPIKAKNQKKAPISLKKKKQTAKKNTSIDFSDDSFLYQLDKGRINYKKRSDDNDFDDLELEDDEL